MKKEDLDLSFIKENDMDKTAAFEDLMTRAERKRYLEEKASLEDKTVEFQTEDLMEHISEEKKVHEEIEKKEEKEQQEEPVENNIEDKNKKSKKNKKKKKNKNKQNNETKENNEKKEDIIEEKKEKTGVISIKPEEKKEIIEELKLLTEEDDNEEEIIEKTPNVVNNFFLSLFFVCVVAYYVYLNITNQSIKKDYQMVLDISLIVITLNYCISMISIKRTHIIFSLFTYLFIIAYIAFNVLLFFKVI